MNVYNLHFEINSILSRVEEDGEIPSQELLEAIDRLNSSIPDRINTLYKALRTAVAASTALRNEVQYTLNKARRWENIQEFIKESMFSILKALNVKSFETDLCRPTICKGPPRVEVTEGYDIERLEDTRWNALLDKTITLNTKKVKEYHHSGAGLPDQIKIVEGEPYLRIL